MALAAGWWRVDLAGMAARMVPLRRGQAARALAQLVNLTLGVGLTAAVAVIIINVS